MKAKEKKKKTENNLAQEFLDRARLKGLDKDFLFTTTFNRYLSQIELLAQLNEDFKKCETTVSKEYVKGRETITAHPLITKINQTTKETNDTTNLLNKLITTYNKKDVEITAESLLNYIDMYNKEHSNEHKLVLAEKGDRRGELRELDYFGMIMYEKRENSSD